MSTVGKAAFGPGGPGSNPGCFPVSNLYKIELTQIIQVCGALASTVTLQLGASLWVVVNSHFSC